ncbi:uncharacterized protein LOC132639696 [Lycium barbarum]|uniref:uncharacterized protein LOC132639696 n=1 Tax=Lycium barbarum TaxID=112863 RepID=UPI00293EBAAF|nr:uncharacterized protein LOC132639696 [Lycium barbarum]
MAKAYMVAEFDQHMSEVNKIDNRVKDYLFDIGYHRWSLAHSSVKRYKVMTSNIAESMNAANKDARDLLIYDLLDYVMNNIVASWNYNNRMVAMATSTTLSQKYEELLRDKIIASKRMTVVPSTEYMYTVFHGKKRYVVCMLERSCTCRKFQLDVMPCTHAMAIITKYSMPQYAYCSLYYNKEYFLKTYDVPIHPIPNETTWEIPADILAEVVLPPIVKARAGRPQKCRWKGAGESQPKRAKITCSLCNREGHNRRTCRNPPMEA